MTTWRAATWWWCRDFLWKLIVLVFKDVHSFVLWEHEASKATASADLPKCHLHTLTFRAHVIMRLLLTTAATGTTTPPIPRAIQQHYRITFTLILHYTILLYAHILCLTHNYTYYTILYYTYINMLLHSHKLPLSHTPHYTHTRIYHCTLILLYSHTPLHLWDTLLFLTHTPLYPRNTILSHNVYLYSNTLVSHYFTFLYA